MKKWNYYLVVELPKEYTEKETDDLKSSIESCIADWHYEKDKPITVKKICYTASQS